MLPSSAPLPLLGSFNNLKGNNKNGRMRERPAIFVMIDRR